MSDKPKRKRLRFPQDWTGWAWEHEYRDGSSWLKPSSFRRERTKPTHENLSSKGRGVRAKLVKVEVGKGGK